MRLTFRVPGVVASALDTPAGPLPVSEQDQGTVLQAVMSRRGAPATVRPATLTASYDFTPWFFSEEH